MRTVARFALGICVLVGCSSGTLGFRPVIRSITTDGSQRDTVTILFEINDEDRTAASIVVEFDDHTGAGWRQATLVSTTRGVASANVVRNIACSATWAACEIAWDSWADRVGEDGPVLVDIRLSPSDVDGQGTPVVVGGVTVDNHYAVLSVSDVTVAFSTDQSDMGVDGFADPQGVTLVISNTGPSGTTLDWSIPAGYDAWLVPTVTSGSCGAITDGDPGMTLTLDADVVGQALGASTHLTNLLITDPLAHDDPQSVAVSVTVRNQRPSVEVNDTSSPVTDLYFQCVSRQAAPAPQTVYVENVGEPTSLLTWSASCSETWAGVAPASSAAGAGALAVGASEAVAVSIVDTNLAPDIGGTDDHVATLTIAGSDEQHAASEPALDGDATVLIHVDMLTPAQIDLSEAAFSFPDGVEGLFGPSPDSYSIDIGNSGEVALLWEIETVTFTPAVGLPWLSYDSASGSVSSGGAASNAVTFTAQTLAPTLAADHYEATVTFRDTSPAKPDADPDKRRNLVVSVDVLTRAHIHPETPVMNFFGEDSVFGYSPAAQTLTIHNTGGHTLNASVSDNQAWLTTSALPPIPGGGSATITVSADKSSLYLGTHYAFIAISDPSSDNTTSIVTVEFEIGEESIWVDCLFGSDTTGTGTYDNPFSSIGEAMSVVTGLDYETIRVMPGVYYESIIVSTDYLTIRSHEGPANTIIRGGGAGQGILNGYTWSTMVIGFTIERFYYGIYGEYGVRVEDCIFKDNEGTAIYFERPYWTTVRRCHFDSNGSGSVTSCILFERNYNGVEISNNLFTYNKGTAVTLNAYYQGNVVTFENNTLVGTETNGVRVLGYYASMAIDLHSNIIVNSGEYGVYLTYPADLRNNCFYGNGSGDYLEPPVSTGTPIVIGSVHQSPMFLSTSDYRLQASSACRDAGYNAASTTDPYDFGGRTRVVDSLVDIGCYERQPTDP